MSNTETDNLSQLITKIESIHAHSGGVGCLELVGHTSLASEPLICELVFSMLLWESTIEHATKAIEQLQNELVDLNELRVCTPDELSSILGTRYPKSYKRCQRIISVLNAIFDSENKLTLARLREMNKRDVVEFLSAIDGLPIFATSRVILLGLGWHAFPVDDRLVKMLGRQEITDSSLDHTQQTQRLERMIKASDALSYYTLIEHWAQNQKSSGSTTEATTRSKTKSTKTRSKPTTRSKTGSTSRSTGRSSGRSTNGSSADSTPSSSRGSSEKGSS